MLDGDHQRCIYTPESRLEINFNLVSRSTTEELPGLRILFMEVGCGRQNLVPSLARQRLSVFVVVMRTALRLTCRRTPIYLPLVLRPSSYRIYLPMCPRTCLPCLPTTYPPHSFCIPGSTVDVFVSSFVFPLSSSSQLLPNL